MKPLLELALNMLLIRMLGSVLKQITVLKLVWDTNNVSEMELPSPCPLLLMAKTSKLAVTKLVSDWNWKLKKFVKKKKKLFFIHFKKYSFLPIIILLIS